MGRTVQKLGRDSEGGDSKAVLQGKVDIRLLHVAGGLLRLDAAGVVLAGWVGGGERGQGQPGLHLFSHFFPSPLTQASSTLPPAQNLVIFLTHSL